jgi:hypothetical protein
MSLSYLLRVKNLAFTRRGVAAGENRVLKDIDGSAKQSCFICA